MTNGPTGGDDKGKDLVKRETTAIETDFVASSVSAALAKGEIEAQIDVARKYPRSIKRFMDDAISMATLNEEVAESCGYALPRGKDNDGNDKFIYGASVRLAEIMASAWGNLHIAARGGDVFEKTVTAQAVVIDCQKNVKYSIEASRRITDKNGKRYNDDMINMTMNAAASIALRNVVLRVIPRAYTDIVYAAAMKVAVGEEKTLVERRDRAMEKLTKIGAGTDRILGALKKAAVNDIDLSDLEKLFAWFNSIKGGEMTVDACFPAVTAAAGPTGGTGPTAAGAAVLTPAEEPKTGERRRMGLRKDPKAGEPAKPSGPAPGQNATLPGTAPPEESDEDRAAREAAAPTPEELAAEEARAAAAGKIT